MYTKRAHIHFVGIGGIGMSGIATILHHLGYVISGCDVDMDQKSIEDLKSLGCTIHHGNNSAGCKDSSIDILVYSSALTKDNPEIIAAKERGIPTIPRALMLAELMRMKYSIAIAGAHGKTTTTSFISHILIEVGFDPTVVIGGHLKNISNNARFGNGDFIVAEADESDRSLLKLFPTIAVVTNIDREHLDVYKDLDDIKNTFLQFLSNLPFYGKAFLCDDDQHLRDMLPDLTHIKTMQYGFSFLSDIYATDIHLNPDHSICVVHQKGTQIPLGNLIIPMPGRHNVLNALAATAVALDLGVPFEKIAQALAQFKGVDRRFTFKGTYNGAMMFDDYGHHPTEILNTLAVARRRTNKKLIVAFQPHRYSRTKALWQEFIDVFAHAQVDQLLITDIYAASEKPIIGITAKDFVEALKKQHPQCEVTYVPQDDEFLGIQHNIRTCAKEGDLILFLGAGKINKTAKYLSE
jgi:UDP-N-acetylmuramate--alanine ligase